MFPNFAGDLCKPPPCGEKSKSNWNLSFFSSSFPRVTTIQRWQRRHRRLLHQLFVLYSNGCINSVKYINLFACTNNVYRYSNFNTISLLIVNDFFKLSIANYQSYHPPMNSPFFIWQQFSIEWFLFCMFMSMQFPDETLYLDRSWDLSKKHYSFEIMHPNLQFFLGNQGFENRTFRITDFCAHNIPCVELIIQYKL